MKKILSIVISGILAVGIVGCSNTVEKKQVQEETQQEQTEEQVEKIDYNDNKMDLYVEENYEGYRADYFREQHITWLDVRTNKDYDEQEMIKMIEEIYDINKVEEENFEFDKENNYISNYYFEYNGVGYVCSAPIKDGKVTPDMIKKGIGGETEDEPYMATLDEFKAWWNGEIDEYGNKIEPDDVADNGVADKTVFVVMSDNGITIQDLKYHSNASCSKIVKLMKKGYTNIKTTSLSELKEYCIKLDDDVFGHIWSCDSCSPSDQVQDIRELVIEKN